MEKLVQLFIASEPKPTDPDRIAYKKQISGLLGRIHKSHVKIDEEIYEALKRMG